MNKYNPTPGDDLITLGKKRPVVKNNDGAVKKSKLLDASNVEAQQFVSKIQDLISSSDYSSAEDIIISALNKLQKNILSVQSSQGSGAHFNRPGSSWILSDQRVSINCTTCLGLLYMCKVHPNIFNRPRVQETLLNCLATQNRDQNLPTNVVNSLIARLRPLMVLAANILYFSLIGISKWPSRLLKIYLEDSLGDRIWVDLEECRIFVLNIETAFSPTLGSPRNLMSILFSYAQNKPGELIQNNAASKNGLISNLLGILGITTPTTFEVNRLSVDSLEKCIDMLCANYISNNLKMIYNVSDSSSKTIVTPRYGSTSQGAISVLVMNRLRETFQSINPSSNYSTPGLSSATKPSSKVGLPRNGGVTVNATPCGTSSSTLGPSHLRSSIKTLAILVGIAEVRSLIIQKIEPWLTNPKMLVPGIGLFTLLCLNTEALDGNNFDLGLVLNCIYRLRFKLFKPHVQTSILDSFCRMCFVVDNNLHYSIRLCIAACEHHTNQETIFPNGKVASEVLSLTSLTTAINFVGRKIQKPLLEQIVTTHSSQISSIKRSDSTACISSSASYIIPILYAHFEQNFTKILAEFLHSCLMRSSAMIAHDTLPELKRLVSQELDARYILLPQNCLHEFVRVQMLNQRLLLKNIFYWLKPLFQLLNRSQSSTSSLSQGMGELLSSQHAIHALSDRPPEAPPLSMPFVDLVLFLLQEPTADEYALQDDLEEQNNSSLATLLGQLEFFCIKLSKNKDTPSDLSTMLIAFQLYLYSLVQLIIQIQVASAIRPNVNSIPHEDDVLNKQISQQSSLRTSQAHVNTIRQIRKLFLRWFRQSLPQMIGALASSNSSPDHDIEACKHAIITNCLPGQLLRHAFFIHATNPLSFCFSENIMKPFSESDSLPDDIDKIIYSMHNCTLFNLDMISSGVNFDIQQLTKLLTDVPTGEKMLIQILTFGLEGKQSLENSNNALFLITPVDACDIVCDLVFRCCLSQQKNLSNQEELVFSKIGQLVELMFASATFSYRQIEGDDGHLPQLAYAFLYWKIILSLTCLSAFAPRTVGKFVWDRLPTVRNLMKVIICDEIQELQSAIYNQQTRSKIFSEFVTKEENENNSDIAFIRLLESEYPQAGNLVDRLTRNDPEGQVRLPPHSMLHQLSHYVSLLDLDKRFWSSRDPDFLVSLLESHNVSPEQQVFRQPWLPFFFSQETVNAESRLDFLPLPCLCEYLLYELSEIIKNWFSNTEAPKLGIFSGLFKSKQIYQSEPKSFQKNSKIFCEIISRLRDVLIQESSSEDFERILEIFSKRMCLKDATHIRHAALKSLSMVFSTNPVNNCIAWLRSSIHIKGVDFYDDDSVSLSNNLLNITKLRQDVTFLKSFATLLINSIIVETEPVVLKAFISILSKSLENSQLDPPFILDSVKGLSKFLTERESLFVSLVAMANQESVDLLLDLILIYSSFTNKLAQFSSEVKLPNIIMESMILIMSFGGRLAHNLRFSNKDCLAKSIEDKLFLWDYVSTNHLPIKVVNIFDTHHKILNLKISGEIIFTSALTSRIISSKIPLLIQSTIPSIDTARILEVICSFNVEFDDCLKIILDLVNFDSKETQKLLNQHPEYFKALRKIQLHYKLPKLSHIIINKETSSINCKSEPLSDIKPYNTVENEPRALFFAQSLNDAKSAWSFFYQNLVTKSSKGHNWALNRDFQLVIKIFLEKLKLQPVATRDNILMQFHKDASQFTSLRPDANLPIEAVFYLGSSHQPLNFALSLMLESFHQFDQSSSILMTINKSVHSSGLLRSIFTVSSHLQFSQKPQEFNRPESLFNYNIDELMRLFYATESKNASQRSSILNEIIHSIHSETLAIILDKVLTPEFIKNGNIDPGMVLDFVENVSKASQFSYPVKSTSICKISSSSSSTFKVETTELVIDLVIREAVIHINTSKSNSIESRKKLIDQLRLRVEMLIPSLRESPSTCMNILFRELQLNSKELSLQDLGSNPKVFSSRLLLLLIYWHTPSLVLSSYKIDKSSYVNFISWVTHPSNAPDLVSTILEQFHELGQIHSWGSNLLVGLIGTSSELSEQVNNSASKPNQLVLNPTITQTNASNSLYALAINQPRASIRLLPSLSSLLNGRILSFDSGDKQVSWTRFSGNRLNLTLEMVLNFIELLAWPRIDKYTNNSILNYQSIEPLSGQEAALISPLFSLEAQHFSSDLESVFADMLNCLICFQQSLGKHIPDVYERISVLIINYMRSKHFWETQAQGDEITATILSLNRPPAIFDSLTAFQRIYKFLRALLPEAQSTGNLFSNHPIFSNSSYNSIREALSVVELKVNSDKIPIIPPPIFLPMNALEVKTQNVQGALLDKAFMQRLNDAILCYMSTPSKLQESCSKIIHEISLFSDLLSYLEESTSSRAKSFKLLSIRHLLFKVVIISNLSEDLKLKTLRLISLICERNVLLGLEVLEPVVHHFLDDNKSSDIFLEPVFAKLFECLCMWKQFDAPDLMLKLSEKFFSLPRFGKANKTQNLTDLLASTLTKLSQEGLYEACIENASSAFMSNTNKTNTLSKSIANVTTTNSG